MQQLHLVGFTTDLEGLIFSARKGAKSGGFVVTIDESLLATIEDAQRLRNGAPDEVDEDGVPRRPRPPRPQSSLSPREIQARLRAGGTIESVASEAGVDDEWIARFAAPVLAEQAQVAARAKQMVFTKARLGPSAQPLGLSVRWNLADKGVRMVEDVFDGAWAAYNVHGAVWVVRFHYVSRQKSQSAEWELDLREGELVSRNRLASELGYVEPGRRRRKPPQLEPPPPEPSARSARQAPEPRPAPEAASLGPGRPAPAPKKGASGPKAKAARRPAKTSSASGARAARKATPAKSGRAAKAAKTRKVTKGAARAAGGVKAAPAKRAMSARRAGRPAQKATRGAAKKTRTARAGKSGRTAGRSAKAPRPPADQSERRAAAPTQADAPSRVSHLARPASPMQSAHRASAGPFPPNARPVPPPPAVKPVRLPPVREAIVTDEDRAPEPMASPPNGASRVESPPASSRRAGPTVAVGDADIDEGIVSAPAALPPPRRTRPVQVSSANRRPDPTPASSSPGPEQRLARRLAARQRASADGAAAAPEPAANGSQGDAVWHGPGSGEAPPPVRIRADIAAAASSRPGAEPERRPRRERPLRPR